MIPLPADLGSAGVYPSLLFSETLILTPGANGERVGVFRFFGDKNTPRCRNRSGGGGVLYVGRGDCGYNSGSLGPRFP